MDEPQVTVLIPSFNGAAFLEATLNSVRSQTFVDFEVLMVDDGSTDETTEIMHRFAAMDPRFHAVIQPRNGGLVAARNTGLERARGQFVALLDGDDLWTPEALQHRVSLATQFPSALVVATDFMWFTNTIPDEPHVGRTTLGSRTRLKFAESFATGAPTLLEMPFESVATLHFAWVGATLIRRDSLTAIGNFDPEFVGPEDTLVWLRIARRGPFLFSPRVTAFYRQHSASIVAQYKTPKEFHYLKVLRRIFDEDLSRPEKGIVRSLMADSFHISAMHARKHGSLSRVDAIRHAWNAVLCGPGKLVYWKGLAGSLVDATRRRAPQ